MRFALLFVFEAKLWCKLCVALFTVLVTVMGFGAFTAYGVSIGPTLADYPGNNVGFVIAVNGQYVAPETMVVGPV